MNLSFLPGDLHLSKNGEGFFVVTVAGREILSTKSRRSALGKFHALRAELEEKFPAHEPTETDRAEHLRREVNDSILENDTSATEKRPQARISSAALFEAAGGFQSILHRCRSQRTQQWFPSHIHGHG